MHLILLNPYAADLDSVNGLSSYDMICAADEIINEIQNINNLLKEKNKIINKIGAIMNFKAYTKTKMSKSQIKQFMLFNRRCIETANKLSEIFIEMDSIAKIDFNPNFELHKKSEMIRIYKKFNNISQHQKIAASSLKELLAIGNHTLFVLCH